jgi:S-methylmethionine-dependent homocysteine/selenocysteine methylase
MRTTYREALPQLDGTFLMSDGGLETDLLFNRGWDLPGFASFPLLDSEAGRAELASYVDDYVASARQHGVGLLLETFTWRANPDWAASIGYDLARLDQVNRDAVAFLEEVRTGQASDLSHVVISGNLGPRSDGYVAGDTMDVATAQRYHARQIGVFADSAADLVSAFTMTNVEEAIGITQAAVAAHIPVVISFTVETDGRLPSGQALSDAVVQVDAVTDGAPAYYMVNCAHPTHFAQVLEAGGDWTSRIRGLRTNASTKSHAELDESETLDAGDPVDLGRRHAALRSVLPGLVVLGGCCGTDSRHVDEVVGAWLSA